MIPVPITDIDQQQQKDAEQQHHGPQDPTQQPSLLNERDLISCKLRTGKRTTHPSVQLLFFSILLLFRFDKCLVNLLNQLLFHLPQLIGQVNGVLLGIQQSQILFPEQGALFPMITANLLQ
jgi:hypothetical protein